jgi:hypothetical protein
MTELNAVGDVVLKDPRAMPRSRTNSVSPCMTRFGEAAPRR